MLEAFRTYIESENPKCNIIQINFNLPEYENLMTYRALYDYVNAQYVFGKDNFVFIDEVYPFAFDEYVEYFNLKDPYEAFDKYVLEGGMAGSYLYKDQKAKYDYVADIFNTLIVRDIRKKYKIRNTQPMDRIVDFLMDNVSNLSSARNITNTLGSMHEKIHHTTVGAYPKMLIARTIHTEYQYEGVKVVDIADWLLNK